MVVATHQYLCTYETLKRIRVKWRGRMGELLGDNTRQTGAVRGGGQGCSYLVHSSEAEREGGW